MDFPGIVLILLWMAACAGPIVAISPTQASNVDSTSRILPGAITKFSFGSCHKTQLPHSHIWRMLKAHEPEFFLWTGDAVYTKRGTREEYGDLRALSKAYKAMKASPEYQAFLNSTSFVDGTWDDHDFGINDGGKDVPKILERQKMFLDFIGVAENSPRRERKGVYSFRRHRSENRIIDMIFLDTRSHRDLHAIPPLGSTKIPLGAVFAAFIRALTIEFSDFLSALGVYSELLLSGDVLGEDQWHWLDRVLRDSAAAESDVTIIVSSIQVLTSNSMVESWMHFPRARQRLFKLLFRHRPKGLIILSGDVHYGEIAALHDGRPIEITSSGLTHSCGSAFWGALCPWILAFFSAHRRFVMGVDGGGALVDKNFGTGTIDWKARSLHLAIHSLEDGGRARLSANMSIDVPVDWDALIKWDNGHASAHYGLRYFAAFISVLAFWGGVWLLFWRKIK